MDIYKILQLPTHRLLAYYQKYYRGRNAPNYEPDWESNKEAIQAELRTREHVKRKT